MKKRGLKSTISLADQLLLTLTYFHYPTFAKFFQSVLTPTRLNARHAGSRFANEQERITP